MASPKYVVKQVVHAPVTNSNNTAAATVVAGGTSGLGKNVYLVASSAGGTNAVIQQLVIEDFVASAI